MIIHAIKDLRELDEYSKARLECDGLTRVLHAVLVKSSIPHKVFVGSVNSPYGGIPFHFWIRLDDRRIVDYRLRMWLGEDERIPNGVFKQGSGGVLYNGNETTLEPLPESLLNELLYIRKDPGY